MNGTLSLRPRGLWLVASLELRQRLRSVRWYVALGIWTVVLLGIGVIGLAPTLYTARYDGLETVAGMVFSFQVLLVLFAMLLVLPAMSAGSINGDRAAGTLATLQVSLLSPVEIVLGKLLAGWLTGIAFLLLALPSVVPTALLGQVGIWYAARLVLMTMLLSLCVTAVGLGLSSLTQRPLGSVVLAYVIVFGLTVVLPFVWAVSAVFLQQEREVTEYRESYQSEEPTVSVTEPVCVARDRTVTVPRLDLTQPLMWPNPVVLLAEMAPGDLDSGMQVDLLVAIKSGMRITSAPTHPSNFDYCSPETEGAPEDLGEPMTRAVWPMGAALWIVGAGGSLAIATWRLSVPTRRLGKGTRIA